jgi:hypothetical protein
LATIIPHIEFTPSYATYLFFWQASEEAEEDVAKHRIKEIVEGNYDNEKRCYCRDALFSINYVGHNNNNCR